jgi:hypothetical protein
MIAREKINNGSGKLLSFVSQSVKIGSKLASEEKIINIYIFFCFVKIFLNVFKAKKAIINVKTING